MKRYCEECNYELDDGYKDSETLCGACVNVAELVGCDSCGVDTAPTGFCRVDNGAESVNMPVGTCDRCVSEWEKAVTL